MGLHSKIGKICDMFINLMDFRDIKIVYIVEGANWSIKWDGRYIVRNLQKKGVKCRISTIPFCLKNKVIHFGSVGTFLEFENWSKRGKYKNKIIVTWFHVTDQQEKDKDIVKKINLTVDVLHTSCEITKKLLVEMGVEEEKIVVIPLGVDLNIFKRADIDKRLYLRRKLGLPQNRMIIGSFQKDGNGWGEGLEPKLIKGPDIFCDVVEKLAKENKIHILLTGPARGYVKKRLEAAGISYTHKFLENYLEIADYYNVLDLYLITSRAEGGPKAILECMGCGVPIISTKVGMVNDMFKGRGSQFTTKVEDVEGLYKKAQRLIVDDDFRSSVISSNFKDVRRFDWSGVVEKYNEIIYSKFIGK